MPFMRGPSPIRRTLKYLESCKIVLRDNVKIFTIHFNAKDDHHEGARNFFFWHWDQIQYKNPNVQMQEFKNMTPSPFLRIYLNDASSILIDIDSRDKDEIVEHLENFTAICKEPHEIKSDDKKLYDEQSKYTYFGNCCERHCICEIFGQIPCTSIVKLPHKWRGIPEKNPKYEIPPHFLEPGMETGIKEEE